MGTINRIKTKLLEMEGGAFHRLCDAWLFKNGYENINSNGMMNTTDRVVTGTPDSLLIQSDGQYVFFEYTVQQNGLKNKIDGDINKCLDSTKTGINSDLISEIIVCYIGKLSTHEISVLIAKCSELGISLTLNGLDTISLSILYSYPVLAEEHLGIPLDTGQLLALEDFVVKYNKNQITTPIDNELLFRDKEIAEAVTTLKKNDLLLVSGTPGVGKTLFSVSVVRKIKEKNPHLKSYCIFDKGTDLERDITATFSEPGEYLIFVDDANRLDNRLDYILHYLNEGREDKKFKIIATVRDYARSSFIEESSRFTHLKEISIKRLTDDQIKELVENQFAIKNPAFQTRIQDISRGNPRLAVMASKIAIETDNLLAIQNVASLYDDYFGNNKNVKDIIDNEKLMMTSGIISFFRKIDRLNENQMRWIQDVFYTQPEEFWENVKVLHQNEIVDLYENEVVKISDQVLSTYLFYYAVFKKKLISFSHLINNFFPDFRKTIVDALNPVIDAFDHKQIIDDIRKDIRIIYDGFLREKSQDNILLLLGLFWFAIPTETLLYAKNTISDLDEETVDWSAEDFKAANSNAPETSLVHLLSRFRNFSVNEFALSFELLLDLLPKSKDSLPFVLRELNERYNFKHDDRRYGYYVQKTVVKQLWNKSQKGSVYLYSRLFIEVARSYLHVEFHHHKWRRGNTLTSTRFRLTPDEYIMPIREALFAGLSILMEKDIYRPLVIGALEDYIGKMRFNGKEMMEADSNLIRKYIVGGLSKTCLTDNLFTLNLCHHYDELGIDYPSEWKIEFANEATRFADLLIEDRHERLRQLKIGYQEYQEYRKEKIARYFEELTIDTYKKYLENCLTLYSTIDRKKDNALTSGMELCFTIFADKQPDLFAEMVSIYLKFDEKFNLNAYTIIGSLFKVCSSLELYALVINKNFKRKKLWLSAYYSLLPIEDITLSVVENLVKHFETSTANELPSGINFLEKYQQIDPDIFAKITRILLKRANETNLLASPLEHLFNPYSDLFGKWYDLYSADVSLVYESYIAAYRSGQHLDHSGEALDRLSIEKKDFLLQFIDLIFELEKWPSSHTDIPKLEFLWGRENYLEQIEQLAFYILNKERDSDYFHDNIFKRVFYKEQGHAEELLGKQKLFFSYTLERNAGNSRYICFIFSVISIMGDNFKRELISFLVERNKDFSLFKKIEIEPSSRSYSGSLVPYLEDEKKYLLSLLPLLGSADLLEHKHYIEKQIENKIEYIESEKKRDFLESRDV